MRKIEGNIRRAIEKYDLIENGDKIAVGLSGGKDSLALLAGLANVKKYAGIDFDLMAILVDNGNPGNEFSGLQKFCDSLGVELHIVKSDIYQVVFEIRKESNPCALCAKMRRGLLCTAAKGFGANKLALGHHADDMLDTFFMSLLFEGRLSTFKPKSFLDRTGITVIRPLILCFEEEIRQAAKELPVQKNPCPANGDTSRERVKKLVEHLEKTYGTTRQNMFKALISTDRYNLLD